MLSILKVTTVEYSDVWADCVSDAKAGILEASRYVDTCNLTFFTRDGRDSSPQLTCHNPVRIVLQLGFYR